MGHRLRRCVRSGDTVARLGGDEFAVLMNDLDPQRRTEVAAAPRTELTGVVTLCETEVPLRASIGMATGHPGRHDPDSLLHEADMAMHAVKNAARASRLLNKPFDSSRSVAYLGRVPELVSAAIPAGSLAARSQPDITGNGVVLRPWRSGDVAAVVAAYADPDIRRWHVRSVDEAEAREWIDGWAERWRAETDAGWAVTRDGVVAGQIALRRLDLLDGKAAISYWVLPAARGSRLASRALDALTAWAFTALGLHRIEVSHSTANPRSCRVAERSGFAAEGILRSEALHADGWHDMHLHARIRPDEHLAIV